MRKLSGVVVAFVLVLAVTACTPTQQAAIDCLSRSTVVDLNGAQAKYPSGTNLADDVAIDARDASWAIPGEAYPVYFRGNDGPNLCIVGGTIERDLDHNTTTWSQWHDAGAGILTKSSDLQVILTSVENVGDGFRFGTGDSSDWTLRGVQGTRVHDDCIENDQMHAGVVDDSFFNGCYVFFSARSGTGSLQNGSANTVSITNSLVWMEPMPHVYNPTVNDSPGHGPVWKMGNGVNGTTQTGIGPQLEIRNTILRIDQDAVHGSLAIPTYDHDNNPSTPNVSYLNPANCSNNTIVWLGGGTMPGASTYPSSCFTITTDIEVWNDAVDAWLAAH